jgi:hypothetical protein
MDYYESCRRTTRGIYEQLRLNTLILIPYENELMNMMQMYTIRKDLYRPVASGEKCYEGDFPPREGFIITYMSLSSEGKVHIYRELT